MPKYPKKFKDVEYHAPGRKRKVAGSTKAINDFLVVVHGEHPKLTIRQLKELITDRSQYIYQPDAVKVLDAYINAGFENYVPKWK